MTDKQQSIYDISRQKQPPPLADMADQPRTRFSWLVSLLSLSVLTSIFYAVAFVWSNFGHLFLPYKLTYAAIFGDRQGIMAGQQSISSSNGTIYSNNAFNDGTARSEGRKQSTVIKETTTARAEQEARVQAEVVAKTGALNATAECLRHIQVAAASEEARCLGTGISGGECSARSYLIQELAPQCGSLSLQPFTGEPAHVK